MNERGAGAEQQKLNADYIPLTKTKANPMQLSAKTEYACLAILELSLHQNDIRPLRIDDIASRHGIPSRFLVQILLQLKAAGIVLSIRGAAGGYRLAKPAETISLGEVMTVIAGDRSNVVQNSNNITPMSEALFETWESISQIEQEKLCAVTFEDLLEQAGGQNEDMYYI
jgi:Rrf2 family protein